MEDFDAIQQRLASSDVIFSNHLNDIMNLRQRFSVIAHEYDVNEHFEMNGYRSMIVLTTKYFAKLRSVLESPFSSPDLEQYRAAAPTLVSLKRLMLDVHEKKNGDDSLKDFTELLQFTDRDVQPFHSSIRGFYLRPELRSLMNDLVMGVILTNISIYNLFSILLRPRAKERLFTRLALDGTVQDIRNLWGPAEFGVVRLIQWVKFLFSKGYMEQITCSRQSKFVISREGEISSKAPDPASSDSISIAYLTNEARGVSPRDSLIFHCHGGGYVSSTYRSHEAYLREWGRKLRVPIVCCSYRICPEHPYPASLQDLLDAYLFVTSGSQEVLTKIGFHPKNIIVTGDSAGGNLALSLVLALNEIQKCGTKVVMPASIALQYPNGNPAVESSCSRIMSLIDPTITLSGMGQAAAAYFGVEYTGHESWFRSEVYEDVARAMISKMKTDPLYNPLISPNYADLQQIKLFILAAEFDPLLDDAVAIGRVWRGPLVMDLAHGLPHSFMSYAGEPDVRDALDVAIRRIAEGLGIGNS